MAISELVRDYNEATTRFHAAVEAEFKAAVTAFFEEHPICVAVRWNQYTPYFNDGDPCVFSVDDPYFKCEGEGTGDAVDEDADSEGFSWSFEDGSPEDKAANAWSEGPGQVLPITSAMEQMFGDHSTVTATANGFDVEDYDHD